MFSGLHPIADIPSHSIATVGGLLFGAVLGLARLRVMALVPAAVAILLAGMTAGYAGGAVVGLVATQVGYLIATLMAAQRRTVST
jgi:hypothetical protein